ncbi:uncharacterized protein LOC134537834 isoform X2 [Bacillus rossius redtenbacheri]
MISPHSDLSALEASVKKGWNSETWPNHLANQSQESNSSRRRESHLGKNDYGIRPVRLRSLVPELFDMPSDNEEAGESNKSGMEHDWSTNLATSLSTTSSDEDVMEGSLEDGYVGNARSTNLYVLPEEVNQTQSVVRLPGSRTSNSLASDSWNVTPKTVFNKPVCQSSKRSHFAEELQKLDTRQESESLRSVSADSVPRSDEMNSSEKPPFFKQPKPKRDVFVNSGVQNRPNLKDIGSSPFVNSARFQSDQNGAFHTSANKENIYPHFGIEVSDDRSKNTKNTPNNYFNDKIISSKNGLGLHYEKKLSARRVPLGQNGERIFDIHPRGHELSSSREELASDVDEKWMDMHLCKRCLRKGGLAEKGIQCTSEKLGEGARSESRDKAVQCEFETADKGVTADRRPKSEEKAAHTLVVKGKRYNVLSKLGSGGSSVVYQVLDPISSSFFAVKCVRLPVEQEATTRGYINEIKLLQQLQDNDCVITLHDFELVSEQEVLYVVMEKGDTDLSKLIRECSKKRKKLSVPMIVYYWTEMLNAVKCIHDHGIVHSDLKPANFLLVCGRLKLIDFGIASSVQSDMTSVLKDSFTGTLTYMSPESMICSSGSQGSKKYKVSYRSDVWSLGCILYSFIYGRTPFQHIEQMHMKIAAIMNPETRISFPADERIPRVLMETLKRCLVYDSKKRPTIAELLAVPYISDGAPTG